jgi:hypothetical protein
LLVFAANAADTGSAKQKAAIKFKVVDVTLPSNDQPYPPGPGADAANGYCLMCHSASMALKQPPLTEKEWAAEVNKMRTAFGAPVPDDQVSTIVHYLSTVNGRSSDAPKSADGKGG